MATETPEEADFRDPTERYDLGGPCACARLRKASRAVARHYERHFGQAGLTATQFSVLRCLEREGPMPLSRIAEELVMDRTTVYRALTPLLNGRLLEVVAHPTDRRARVAKLTSGGHDQLRQARPHWSNAQREFLQAIEREDWRDIAAEVTRITEKLTQWEQRGV